METIILTIFLMIALIVFVSHAFEDGYETEDYFELDEDYENESD
ncbi:hypothetical protein [Methanobrevibacter sp.]